MAFLFGVKVVSNCEDTHLINIFLITVMEILGNDTTILEKDVMEEF